MSGPFRTPAKVNRAPIPPHGHHEWHPRPELLNALDIDDAFDLEQALRDAREDYANTLWLTFISAASFAILAWALHGVIAGARELSGAALACLILTMMVAVYGWLSRVCWRRALRVRDRAYVTASRALEAKLARDERPRILRALIGGAA
jgi:hypothetical protein